MPTLTRLKLEEAAFFLEAMRQHPPHFQRLLADDPLPTAPFRYYLSAFISAARSVTWVMRAEFSRRPSWEDWFTAYPLSAPDRDLLKAVTTVRNRSEKVVPLQPGLFVTAQDSATLSEDATIEGLGAAPQTRYRITIRPVKEDGSVGPPIATVDETKVGWALPEFREDVLLESERYFAFLARLVTACEAAFP